MELVDQCSRDAISHFQNPVFPDEAKCALSHFVGSKDSAGSKGGSKQGQFDWKSQSGDVGFEMGLTGKVHNLLGKHKVPRFRIVFVDEGLLRSLLLDLRGN